ncbi:MAG: hypothetical protein HZA52_18915 [Planctomycetes bacterium]|nr:hypothetical protein [Planctomycetota bacterium]
MTVSKRVLLLGTTGVSKQNAFDSLIAYRESVADDVSQLVYKDFERDYLKPLFNNQMPEFLDAAESHQQLRWNEGWVKLIADCRASQDVIFLGLHGVLVRELYGVRALAYIDRIREFAPTHIITLIDDVYLEHVATERRAGGLEYIGRPSLSQLIDARRAELLVGDLIRRNIEAATMLNNWLLAVRHPARVLDRIVFGTERLIPIYLSFPITGPRKMLRAGNGTGIEQVDDFLRKAADRERANRHLGLSSSLSG